MDRKAWLWKKRSSAVPDLHEHHVQDENVAPNTDCRASSEVPEETIKLLSEKLAATQAELAASQDLVKQHIKVADEAVSGWEKSENEAASLKQQLEEAVQQRMAVEERVAQLDNALKECVRQLRLLREEQESKIQEAVTRRTREWDIARRQLTSQLADVTNQLAQEGAQSNALSKSLQERSRAVVELTDAKLQAEKESQYFQTRLETIEKDNRGLQYDFQVLQKESEIRKEENEYNQRMLEAANKQQLEAVKKNAKLEAEVQRLRMLVKKKLPGPAALSEMRTEVGESRSTSDRMRSIEEEATLLKEVLAKRNGELEEARSMCAKTASKLSSLEQELKSVKVNQVRNGSTAVEEARHLKPTSCGLMDDFIEMERLALTEQRIRGGQECEKLRNKLASAEEQLKQKQASIDVLTANDFDGESRARLRSAVARIIHLVESMVHEYAGVDSSPEMDTAGGVQRLVSVSKNLLQGKVPILDFVSELPRVLDFVVGLNSGSSCTMESSGSRRSCGHKPTEDVIQQLKSDVSDLESKLRAARDTVQELSSELSGAQEEVRALKRTITAVQEDKEAAVSKLASMVVLKDQLEERLKNSNADARQLRESLDGLRRELQEEQGLRQDAENKLVSQQQQQLGRSKEESVKLQKERELAAAAEKLAECQRTILMLGKQLESLGMEPAEDKNGSRVLEEPAAGYQHIRKQETYWSSLNQLDGLLYDGDEQEAFEVKTPMRHQQQQRRTKIAHGSSEMSKSMAAADLSLPPEKHGLAKLFSRVKGHH